MLTRDTLELVVTSVTFLVLGMFLGNRVLLVLGLAPIIFLSLGVIIGQPRVAEVTRGGSDAKVNVDDHVEDSVTATITGGPGIVALADVLPNSFKLEEGTNFKAVWKGLRDKTVSFGYRATCAKRGFFELPDISWEVRHPLQIAQNQVGTSPAPRTFVVQPSPMLVRRVREHKALSRIPMPMGARFKFGIPTTDFLEIREYSAGDPYRMINWKASAKLLSTKPGQFLVNEYEKEGKKVVWVFLDSASHMALGTKVSNTMEYAVRAVLGFSHFYLGRDCQVGLCIYDHDAYQWEGTFQSRRAPPEVNAALEDIDQMESTASMAAKEEVGGERQKVKSRVLFPDTGRRQEYKITREMLYVDVRYSAESLKEAIHSCRRHILGTRPLFVIITMVEAGKLQGLVEGVRELYRYVGRLRGRPSIIVFNVMGYSVAAQSEEEKIAAGLLSYHTKPYHDVLRRLGCVVVNWDPVGESFAAALQRQRA